MSPDLSRRLGNALGTRRVTFAERDAIIGASEADGVNVFDDLPDDIRALVVEIEARKPVELTDLPRVPGPTRLGAVSSD